MADNYVSTNVESGVKMREALNKINSYKPESFVWIEASKDITVDLKSPTSSEGISDPGNYVIYNFSNGPSEIPSTVSPVLLSIMNGKNCVSANGEIYVLNNSGDTWEDINDNVDDTTVLYIKSDTAPNRTSNTFWFDTSKFNDSKNGEISLKYFDSTTEIPFSTEGTISSNSSWYSVYYGNDKFVTVAYNSNYFAYSTDGINWTEGTISDTSRNWQSVCYGNGKYVAVANSSKYFAYSTDGIHWTEGTISNTSRSWQSVCYGNGKFIIIGNTNYFAYSTDGINWTESTISSTSRYWDSVCYGNGKFVAVAWNTNNYFAYSTDGINWTESTISDTNRNWNSVCYGNGKFVAVTDSNYFAYSTDGINWTEGTISSTSRSWQSVCYGNGKFVTVADNSNYFAYSTDGINWTEGTISDTERMWCSICYGNDKFVTVSQSNYFANITFGPANEWISVFSNTDLSDYLKKSELDPSGIGTDIYQYIDDKISQFIDIYNNFNKHKNNELTYIHITEDDASRYANIINESELQELINTTYKPLVQSLVDAKIDTIDTETPDNLAIILEKEYKTHLNGHITSEDIANWNNKAEVGHTHNYVDNDVQINADKIVSGTFSLDRLPDEIKERYYQITSDLETEFGNASITDSDRKAKYHEGNGFYYDTTDSNGESVRKWYRIIDSSKIGTENWSEGIVDFTSRFESVDWTDVDGVPTTFEEFGFENPLYNKTNIDDKFNPYTTQITTMNNDLDNCEKDVSYDYETVYQWTQKTLPSSRNWYSVCYGNDKFVTVASSSNYFAYSTDGIHWTEGTISSTSRNWYSVCYGNDKFVAVAYRSNYFAYSTDGINWTESTISSTSRAWWSVCYGNGKFVAVANGSKYFAYSTDGINWTEGTISDTNRNWRSVCYGNDKFVAVAQNSNYFAYSTDGINWTEVAISSTSRLWKSICYGNDKFVTVVYNSKYFAYSTDGIHWTESTISSTSRNWYSVCYGNDKFVAVSQSNYYAYSTDGITWTEGTISSTIIYWESVCYGNGKFVTISTSNYFAYSTGNSVSTTSSKTDSSIFVGPSKIGIQYKITDITDYNDTMTGTIPQVDCIILTTDDKIYKTTYNLNSKYLKQDGSYYTTSNSKEPLGATLIEVKMPSGTTASSYFSSRFSSNYSTMDANPNYATSGCGICVTASSTAKTLNVPDPTDNTKTLCTIEYSTNGIKFIYNKPKMLDNIINVAVGSTDKLNCISDTYENMKLNIVKEYGGSYSNNISSTSRQWWSVCYGNGKFVVVGYNVDSKWSLITGNDFAYSTDGIHWTEGTISSTSRQWRSVCYGNGKFVTVAYNTNYFAYSTDGINWTEDTISSTSRSWQSVCYGNDKFVVVAWSNNYFAYSTDGINWTEGTISDTNRNWRSVCYGNDKFVAVSDNFGPNINGNYFAYSTDGINWTESTISSTRRQWISVCYGNDKFVAVAQNSNYFAYSTDGINWTESMISSTSRNWSSVCYGNGKFVAIAYDSNYFTYSTDGIKWYEVELEYTLNLTSVCYSPELDRFVAVGPSGFTIINAPESWTAGTRSTLAVTYTWTNISSDNTSVLPATTTYVKDTAITVDTKYTDKSVYVVTDGYYTFSGWDKSDFNITGDTIISGRWSNKVKYFQWTEGTMPSSRDWQSVCYGNDKFVAVAYNSNYFAYSTDGITWTESTISSTSRQWRSVCYGNDKFVVVGYDAYSAYLIPNNNIHVTTDDKTTWAAGISKTDANTYLDTFKSDMSTYADEQINNTSAIADDLTAQINTLNTNITTHIADSSVHITEEDAARWDAKAPGDHTHNNDGTVTVSAENVVGLIPIERLDPSVLERNYTVSSYSEMMALTKNEVQNGDSIYINDTHPTAWFVIDDTKLGEEEAMTTEGTISNTSRNWYSVCYGNDKFVTVANTSNYFAYSTDGIHWTEGTISDTIRYWKSVCYGNGKYVAISRGTSNYFAYSTDGINWTEGTISDTSRNWSSVCYGNNKFVTVTYYGSYFAYSTDGITWTEGTISGTSRLWYSVCYGNDKFVAVAYDSNYYAYSTDGINWTEGTISNTSRQWQSVCYGNGKYVAVGNSNYFAYSTNGINWTEGTISDTSRDWWSICYGNDKFVAVATNYFAYSTNGINWTEGTISNTSRYWQSVCYGNGKFVAVAYNSNYFANIIFSPAGLIQYATPAKDLTWDNIENKPNTLAGYNITDCYTKDEIYSHVWSWELPSQAPLDAPCKALPA